MIATWNHASEVDVGYDGKLFARTLQRRLQRIKVRVQKPIFVLLGAIFLSSPVLAQGQDSTPTERDIMILGELLPGRYDNANQSYFDVRLKRPEIDRHQHGSVMVERISAPDFGDYVFSAVRQLGDDESGAHHFVYALSVDNASRAVRMKTYHAESAPKKNLKRRKTTYLNGCDVLWSQEAGQFRGAVDVEACAVSDGAELGVLDWMLSVDALWMSLPGNVSEHFAFDRARKFSCYVDVPGVGGGRDIPFERVDLGEVHDLGGEKWAVTKDGLEIGVSLFRVMWTFNNYENVFTRPSFVIYMKTKDENGDVKENGYSWTIPEAERIGINLKWALANCFMLSNEEITPFYKRNEPKVRDN